MCFVTKNEQLSPFLKHLRPATIERSDLLGQQGQNLPSQTVAVAIPRALGLDGARLSPTPVSGDPSRLAVVDSIPAIALQERDEAVARQLMALWHGRTLEPTLEDIFSSPYSYWQHKQPSPLTDGLPLHHPVNHMAQRVPALHHERESSKIAEPAFARSVPRNLALVFAAPSAGRLQILPLPSTPAMVEVPSQHAHQQSQGSAAASFGSRSKPPLPSQPRKIRFRAFKSGQWFAKYHELQAYKKKYGHCHVPHN